MRGHSHHLVSGRQLRSERTGAYAQWSGVDCGQRRPQGRRGGGSSAPWGRGIRGRRREPSVHATSSRAIDPPGFLPRLIVAKWCARAAGVSAEAAPPRRLVAASGGAAAEYRWTVHPWLGRGRAQHRAVSKLVAGVERIIHGIAKSGGRRQGAGRRRDGPRGHEGKRLHDPDRTCVVALIVLSRNRIVFSPEPRRRLG